MKKFLFTACAAALFLSVSCQKDDFKMSEGTPVSVVLSAPTAEGDAPELKVSHSQSGTAHTFTWEAGDEISLIAYGRLQGGVPTYTSTAVLKTEEGGSPATFKGDLGTSYRDTLVNVWALYPKTEFTSIAIHDSKARLTIKGAVINPVQDGTGYKYCYFCSRGTLQTEGGVTSFSSFPDFVLVNTLLRFNVVSSTPVKCITITLADAKSGTGLCGNLELASSSTGVMGGCSGKTLTIKNDGAPLEDVVVSTRKIATEAGKTTTLTFKCYSDVDESDLLFTRVITLTDDTASAKIYDLGTLQPK